MADTRKQRWIKGARRHGKGTRPKRAPFMDERVRKAEAMSKLVGDHQAGLPQPPEVTGEGPVHVPEGARCTNCNAPLSPVPPTWCPRCGWMVLTS